MASSDWEYNSCVADFSKNVISPPLSTLNPDPASATQFGAITATSL